MARRKPAPPPEPLPDIVAIVAQYMANPTQISPVIDRLLEDEDAGAYDLPGGNFEFLTTIGNLTPGRSQLMTVELAARLWFAAAEREGHSWNWDRFSSTDVTGDFQRRLGFCFSGDGSWYSFQPDWSATSLEDVRWTAKRWHFRNGYTRGSVAAGIQIVRAHWQSAPVYFDAPSYAWANAGAAGLLSCVVAAADYANRIEAANAAKGTA